MAEAYPIAFEDEGGVQIPHIPTTEEKENCAFVKKYGAKCTQGNCGDCSYHPYQKMAGETLIRGLN